jgi:hypothetical protein
MSSRTVNCAAPSRFALALVTLAALSGLWLGASAQPAQAVSLSRTQTSAFYAPFHLPFSSVDGIAASPDGAYVYVGTAAVVIQYSDSGVWQHTWSTTFSQIGGIATDPFGNVYVADAGAGQVQKFDENGTHVATWSVPGIRQIAADAHGRVFLLVNVIVGNVVDVRSYTGSDEGAWPVTLSGSWFNSSGYAPATPGSIVSLGSDAAGNVALSGSSSQRLEGSGPDCHNVFEADHRNEFDYDDPLVSGEVERYSYNGTPLSEYWVNNTSVACYPGWHSSGAPLWAIFAPDDDSIWLAQEYGEFLEDATHAGHGAVTTSFETTNTPVRGHLLGPATFDCHGDLLVGSGDHVTEFFNLSYLKCPRKPSKFAKLVLAPALTFVKQKKKKNSKALNFEAGCLGHGCTIEVTARLKLPHCHRGPCLPLLSSGHFTLSGGRPHSHSLLLTHDEEGLLRGDLRPELELSARMLRHGKPSGPTFRAGGGHPLLARGTVAMSLSCPAQATLGSQIVLSGALGLAGVHMLSLAIQSPGGGFARQRVDTSSRGAFGLSAAASAPGTYTFAASYAGDRLHAPAGAGCSTVVPAPPPHAVKPPPPPMETSLSLSCRALKENKPHFSGSITPVLTEVPVTITYRFTNPGSPEPHEKVDLLKTNSNGRFEDTTENEPLANTTGEAVAAWEGEPGYTAATSSTCKWVVE